MNHTSYKTLKCIKKTRFTEMITFRKDFMTWLCSYPEKCTRKTTYSCGVQPVATIVAIAIAN